MEASVVLPEKNEDRYYEMRLESIGGLGANLCGKMLGTLGAVALGLHAAAFSSYGSEKRGSPVKSYIRYAEREIRISSPVERPHILVLFHEALAGKYPVTAGVQDYTKIVVNTDRTPEEAARMLGLEGGEMYCVDAQKIAMECGTRINMVLLGAVVRASGFIPMEAAEKMVRETIGKKYPDFLKANMEGLYRGYREVRQERLSEKGFAPVPYKEAGSTWGYKNAPIGGVNPRFGSTVSNELTAAREGWIPLFLPERCINCNLCDSTCPDMVFQFKPGIYRGKEIMVNTGLDYHHCKGCLRCVDVCPVNALVAGKEREHPKKEHFARNRDLIVDRLEYEDAGANSWVTSDSYFTEKRVDNGGIL